MLWSSGSAHQSKTNQDISRREKVGKWGKIFSVRKNRKTGKFHGFGRDLVARGSSVWRRP